MKDEILQFGIINIDKPAGPTSFSVSSFVMRELGLNKTSHLGTLDPKVSGVLPITLGRACKLAGYFIGHDKEYVGVLHCHKEQDIKELQRLINENFVGKIKQTPPHKSAVKRAEREREVYFWELIESDLNGGNEKENEEGEQTTDSQKEASPKESSQDYIKTGKNFLFRCSVEGGTYIRKLCSDLGEMIGGAHMEELRRSRAGLFDESKIYTLFEFEEAVKEYKAGKKERLLSMIVPAEEAIVKVMPRINVNKRALKPLLSGKFLLEGDVLNKKDFDKIKKEEVFLIFIEDKFVEVARRCEDIRGVARSEFVYN